ncbi:polyprenyl synthetase family protein [Leucobacter insecticola]|uniref:Polyprenyl synthetase family protein n=1 Tax=Leucobacter insecticola TaxID=2714934 RepID=A0A6G8FJJ8_9MICO|nr:polyprenyl synthetase family protein [Leucobacter insecticola]QIM16534.1 polyprenyl synthetase family protein [Leucobacter insecticola]
MRENTVAQLKRAASAEAIETELQRQLAVYSQHSTAYGAHFAELWEITSECILGGKLIRPRLLIGAFDALANSQAETPPVSRDAVIRIAAATELLHYSFLLHDDVIDGDLFRRGRPNLIGTLLQVRRPEPLCASDAVLAQDEAGEQRGPLHWARTSGILMGDLLLSATHQIFAREALPEEIRIRLLDILDHTITESVVGEHLDVGLSDGLVPADLDTVLNMSRLKTATYTFELPLRAALVLAGASARAEMVVGMVGRHLGIAFQLQDDLLSTFGDATEHGKDMFSDLREGKETVIIAYARMSEAWPSIEPYHGRANLTEEDGVFARKLLIECGAEGFIRSLIDEQIRTCIEFLAQPDHQLPVEVIRYIEDLVASLEERRS